MILSTILIILATIGAVVCLTFIYVGGQLVREENELQKMQEQDMLKRKATMSEGRKVTKKRRNKK